MSIDLSSDRRFSGLPRLYGAAGAARIRRSHVAVVGIGGVGSWAAEALARSGVAALTLIDMDHVAESNINRQIHATDVAIGQAKVLAMQARIASFHPACQVHAIEEFAAPDNWPGLLPAGVDAVIDACDQLPAKLAMAAWALQTGSLFVCVGAAGGKRLAHKLELDDLAAVTHDPMLAKLRYSLRKQHGAPSSNRIGVACVFSREPVARAATGELVGTDPAAQDGSLNCHGYGSVVTVTASFGQCAAGWVLNELAQSAVSVEKPETRAIL